MSRAPLSLGQVTVQLEFHGLLFFPERTAEFSAVVMACIAPGGQCFAPKLLSYGFYTPMPADSALSPEEMEEAILKELNIPQSLECPSK